MVTGAVDLGEHRRATETLDKLGLDTAAYFALNKVRAGCLVQERDNYHGRQAVIFAGAGNKILEDQLGIQSGGDLNGNNLSAFSDIGRLAAALWSDKYVVFGSDGHVYTGQQGADKTIPTERLIELSRKNPAMAIYTLDAKEPVIRTFRGGQIVYSSLAEEITYALPAGECGVKAAVLGIARKVAGLLALIPTYKLKAA